MKTTKIIVITLITVFIFSCKSKNNNVSNRQNNLSPTEKRIKRLSKQVVIRTKSALRKYGIRKVLLDNSGMWIVEGELFHFFRNGKVRIKFDGSYDNLCSWKIVDGKLYFNLNKWDTNLENDFFEMKVKVSDFSYSFPIKILKNIKYRFELSGKITKIDGEYYNYSKRMFHYYNMKSYLK